MPDYKGDSSSSDIIGIMQELVRTISNKVEYVDSLYTDTRLSAVTKDSTEEKLSMPLIAKGVVFRLLKRGEWREAAFGNPDKSDILEQLRSLAEFYPATERSGNGISLGEPWKADMTLAGKRDPRSVEPEEKLEVVRRNYEIAKGYDPRIINVNSGYREIIDERAFVNSEGSELHEVLCRVYYGLSAIAREGERIEYDYCTGGMTGGFETVDNLLEEDIKEVSRSAISLLSSSQVPSGTFNVVLDPGMTGTFAHESFGHGCEADQVLRGRSYLVNYLGEKLGPENFNLYDDGALSSGAGSMVFDDEGNKPQRTSIIQNGELVHFMQDRITSKEMHEKPTGNARRESYKRMIYVRMTNTYIDPGDFTFEELLKETKDGIFLEHWNSGIEDPIGGNMQLKCKKARRIKNGELGEAFSTTVVSGRVLDFMANVKGMTKSSDFAIDPGFCGKGTEDHVTVGSGGSFLASVATIGQG